MGITLGSLSAHPEKSLLFSFSGLLFLSDGISPEEGVSLPKMKALPFPLGHILLILCALFAPSLCSAGAGHWESSDAEPTLALLD